jgi:uncharacterized phiE125 gp8 family phage protein
MSLEHRDQILRRTVKPVVLPVTLAQAKADLREERDIEDALIESLIMAATDFMEAPNGAIGKAFITQTWQLSVPCPDRLGRIELPITPAQSIESINYFDGAGVQQSVAVSDFNFYGEEDWAYLTPKTGKAWPALADQLDAITITYRAGFGDSDSGIPASIGRAIRMLVVHWFENKGVAIVGTSVSELPMAVKSLVSINRKGWVK